MPNTPEHLRAVIDEYERQQAQLKQQAMQLEEQAAELELQIVELAEANAALKAAEERTAQAHRRTMAEMNERLRQAVHFDAAMRTAPVAIAILDRDLRYLRMNEAGAAMTGLSIAEHIGRTVQEVNPLVAPDVVDALRRAVDLGEPTLDYRISRIAPHATNGVMDTVMQISPIRDGSGAIVGVCSIATNVSEWKALQDQLNQAQKLEAVGQLAAGIAHDFNNLLTVISSLSDLMLLEMGKHSPHRTDVEEIRRVAERAAHLARRMLGMAHSQAIVLKPIDLRAVIQDAEDLLRRAVGRGATLELVRAPGRGVVAADPTQIEQILLNLVINAADAMPEGGNVTIAICDLTLDKTLVTRAGELKPGNYVELLVSDAGTGMSPETEARIFEPFFTTKAPGKGTGLGLPTVFAIVRDLGGGISLKSVPGQGTTFRILLPRLTTEEGSGPRRQRETAAANLPRGTETLLLVEDEDMLRAGVSRLLARQGYRVLEARHGGEALRILNEEQNIAVVVSDLNMPGVDGLELSKRMRALGHTPPVLFMSGTGDVSGLGGVRAMVDERDRFIAKPFNVKELLTTVREMIGAAPVS